MHRLADDVFAQHRTHRGQAVAPAGEWCRTRTLEVDVAEPAVGVSQLAEQHCAPVAQSRDVTTELVTGVGLRYRRGPGRHKVADQKPQPVGTLKPCRVEAELLGQGSVESQQPRVGKGLGLPADRHLGQVARKVVVQGHGGVRCDAHPAQPTGDSPRDQRD